jgi:hypothetical protein
VNYVVQIDEHRCAWQECRRPLGPDDDQVVLEVIDQTRDTETYRTVRACRSCWERLADPTCWEDR